MAKAEAAAKRLRDGLGDGLGDPFEPYDKEQQKRKKNAPKEGEQIAGAFARSFSRHLETAAKSLPKMKITADSSEAQTKLQGVRQQLQDLSGKQFGVDINAADAFGKLRSLQMELDRLGNSAEIDIRADAAAALAQLQVVQREADKLSATKPTVRPDVDTSPAQASLADLRRRLDELSSRRIGVDLDAGAARTEIAALQRDLQRLNASSPDIQVRADSAAALAQLRAIQSSVSAIDGRSARVRVNADVSSALMAIGLVGAALASLPAVATIGVGVAGLGAAFGLAGAGALGFAAVAAPSLGRVNEALKEAESSAGGAGSAMKSAAQKALESAQSALSLATAQDAVADAAERVKDAQRGVKDALQGVSRAKADVARVAEDAAARQVQAAARIGDAERSVQDAHRATQRAVEDLTRARERAQERLEDLALATEGGALSEERALLSIKRAQADLARVNADPKASQLDKEDAGLRLREAEFNLKRIREANGDLAKEQAEADAKGVEGSDEVVAAKERILAAQRAESDAERNLAAARAEAVRAAVDGAKSVAEAQARVGEAHRKVAEAQKDVIKAQRDAERAAQRLKIEQLQQKVALEQAAAAAAGGGGGAASKMAELSKAERKLAEDIKKFTDGYEKWQRSLQGDIFPVIRSGMDLLTSGMEIGTPLIKASAGAFDELLKATNKGLQGQQWKTFFDDLTQRAPRAIEGLGTAAGNVAGGLAGIIQAFLPYTDDLATWIEDIAQKFETWGQNLGRSEGFKSFMAYAAENAPKVGEVLGNLATAIGKIINAAAEPGAGVLDFLVTLSEKLAGMDPAQVEAIAKGVGLVFAAIKLGATLKISGFVVLAEVLGRMSPSQIEAVALAVGGVIIAVKSYQAVSGAVGWYQSLAGSIGKAGDAADGAKGKFGGLASSLKTAGIVGLVAGLAGAADNLRDELTGLNPDIDKLAKGIDTFVSTGKGTPELLDQINGKVSALDPSQWESFSDIASRLSSDNPFLKAASGVNTFVKDLSGGFVTMDGGAQRLGNIDTALATMVASGNGDQAARMFDLLAKNAEAGGVPVEKLKTLMPQYAEAVATVSEPTGEAAKQFGEAKTQLDGFTESLAIFNADTDSARAVRELEKSYKDVKRAVAEAGGQLDINKAKTNEQKDAIITARDAFAGYIEKVNGIAESQQKAGKNTANSTIAVAEQLPKLFELAGKSADARDRVYELAEKFGISREMADKAAKGSKDFREELEKLKDKQIKLDMDTKEAEARLKAVARQLEEMQRRAQLKLIGGDNPTSARGNAWGGIQSRDGRPDYMAQGGIRSLGGNPQAMIARQPYHISGRGGPDVIFGEAGYEAFIPLDSSKRDRGLQILGEAAGIMGMAVVPQKMAVNTAGGSATGGSGGPMSGTASVTVTGIGALRSSLDTTAAGLTASLGGATSTLGATLGDAGSLTQSVTKVGEVAGHLAGEVTGWGEVIAVQVPPLTAAVTQLGDALAAAASGDSKGNAGSKGDERSPRGGSSGNSKGNTGSKGDERSPRDAAAKKAAAPVKIAIKGATSGTTGVAMSGGTNWSTTSRPVPAASTGSFAAAAPSSTGAQGSQGATPASGGGDVHVHGLVVRSEADITQVAAQIAMRRGNRG